MTRRARHLVPKDVDAAIDAAGVRKDFELRPPFQQNDYVGWITRAVTDATRTKRLRQMLDELAAGGVYMGMKHGPSAKKKTAASAKKKKAAKKTAASAKKKTAAKKKSAI